MKIHYQSAVLFVDDIQRSREFYESVLDQQVLMDHGLNVGYQAGFALWQRSSVEAALGQPIQPLNSPRFELYFESEEMDEWSDRLTAAGAKFIHPIVEQPWRQRVLRVADPDGYIVEIGEPLPAVIRRLIHAGLTPEDIAKQMYMPIEVVQQLVQVPSEKI